MRKYTLAISISVSMILLTAAVIAYAILSNRDATSAVKTRTTGNTLSTNTQQGQLGVTNQQSATQQTQPINGQLNVDGSRAGGGLQSNLGQQQNNTPASSLPTPDNFEVYDEYKDGQSTLYVDLQVGSGKEAVAGSKVAMLYRGWLTDGTLFDQSRTNAQGQIEAFPFTIGAGQVIKGWDQGIIGMKTGGTRRLVIPPAAGYGPTGQGAIPANAVLVFDVQLVQVSE